jgi:hypothetical protein
MRRLHSIGGWPAFFDGVRVACANGALFLRLRSVQKPLCFLQGRVAMLPTQPFVEALLRTMP